VRGKLVGGLDVMKEMREEGELASLLAEAMA
jgi:glutaredoxin-related protein